MILFLILMIPATLQAQSSAAAGNSDEHQRYVDSVMSGKAAPRLDGSFPDGPFSMKDIPKEVLKPCLDGDGKIAAAGEPWRDSCVGIGEVPVPDARLDVACRMTDTLWHLTC
ncbi:MAG: hypothetical protein HY074_09450, partial [Deltaproteobacteria bacterium]|nr:hypothetical protein [Deltaproteobacteria bacterium]